MRTQVLVSLPDFWDKYANHIQQLDKHGIDFRGLVICSMHYAAATQYSRLKNDQAIQQLSYHNLASYVSKEIVDIRPELCGEPEQLQQLIHQCIDLIGETMTYLTAHFQRICGKFDHTFQIERFLDNGSNDVMVSFEK